MTNFTPNTRASSAASNGRSPQVNPSSTGPRREDVARSGSFNAHAPAPGCVVVSGLCQVAAFYHALHAPKEVAAPKVSGPVKAKTTNWKKRA